MTTTTNSNSHNGSPTETLGDDSKKQQPRHAQEQNNTPL